MRQNGPGILTVCFAPEGTWFAVGNAVGRVAIRDALTFWDLKSRSRLLEIKAHEGIVSVLRLSPDGRRLGPGGIDGKFRVWDTASASLWLEQLCAGIVLDCHYADGDEWLVAALPAVRASTCPLPAPRRSLRRAWLEQAYRLGKDFAV